MPDRRGIRTAHNQGPFYRPPPALVAPSFSRLDRLLFNIVVALVAAMASKPAMIVQAETVLRWRRNGWSAIWGYRSRGGWRGGRPRVSSEVRHLITRIARENYLWGAPRIHGELLMLGFTVSQATVSRYLPAPQTANTVVADLCSQSSHRLRPPPVSRGAFRHGVPEPAVLFLLGQPECDLWGRSPGVEGGTLSLACWPEPRRRPLEEWLCVAAGAHESLCTMPNDWTRRLAAHGKRAASVFRPPLPCEIRRMKLGRHQGPSRARLRILLFARIKFLRSHSGFSTLTPDLPSLGARVPTTTLPVHPLYPRRRRQRWCRIVHSRLLEASSLINQHCQSRVRLLSPERRVHRHHGEVGQQR